MQRLVYLTFGGALAFAGALISFSPMPLGFILLVPGLALMIHGSTKVAAWVRLRRARNLEINERANRFAERAPGLVAEALERTDPKIDPALR